MRRDSYPALSSESPASAPYSDGGQLGQVQNEAQSDVFALCDLYLTFPCLNDTNPIFFNTTPATRVCVVNPYTTRDRIFCRAASVFSLPLFPCYNRWVKEGNDTRAFVMKFVQVSLLIDLKHISAHRQHS